MISSTDLFILDDDGEPQPADVLTWGAWFESHDRTLASTVIGDPPRWHVSTVFVGIDLGWGLDPTRFPLLWESTVFRAGPDHVDMGGVDTRRYRSREAAERGHADLVAEWQDRT